MRMAESEEEMRKQITVSSTRLSLVTNGPRTCTPAAKVMTRNIGKILMDAEDTR